MSAERYDVIVVGLGVMGAATLRALAKKGASVAGIEMFERGHANGSSHGASRIFRFSYHDPTYVGMAQTALTLWRELEREAETTIIHRTGGLDFGRPLNEHVSALQTAGADYEVMDGATLMERWAYFAVPPEEKALYQPDAGIVHADRAWGAFWSGAEGAGAAIFEGRRVRAIETGSDGGMVVRSDDAAWSAGAVVVTAGPWANDLLEPLGQAIPVKPSQETVAYFSFDEALEVPSLVDWGSPAVYSLASPEPAGLKVGLHHAGPHVHPDHGAQASEATIEKVSGWVRERFPSADPVPLGADTCFYTNTPDESFILERRGDIVIGSPCSGHGFKFAPLVGERLAALALGESV